jgi:hypothetical protein
VKRTATNRLSSPLDIATPVRALLKSAGDQDFRVTGGYGTRLKLTQLQCPVSASAGVTWVMSVRRWPGLSAMDIASASGGHGD